MKVVLVLCLLAFISCQKDITDIFKCLYKNPKVKELIADAMIAIVTKDFSELWSKIKESLPELIQIVIKCITANEKGEVNLKHLIIGPPKLMIDYLTSSPNYDICYSRCKKYLESYRGYCEGICENCKKKTNN